MKNRTHQHATNENDEARARNRWEFIRKHDYQRRSETHGREHDSVDRARQLISGTGALIGS